MREHLPKMKRLLPFIALIVVLSMMLTSGMPVSAQSESDPEPLVPCAVPINTLVGQGGFSVDLLGGFSVDALGGFSVDALAVEAGSLAFSVDLLGLVTPAGQAFSVDALGGFSVDALVAAIAAEAAQYPFDYSWLNERLPYIASGHNFGTEPVVIFVLDAFDDPTRSHGEDVFEIANDFVNLPEDLRDGVIASLQSQTGAPIYIVGIDITDEFGNFVINDTDSQVGIATKLSNAVNEWMANDVFRFVFNMSFGLVPCDDTIEIPADEGGTKVVNFNVDNYYNYQQTSYTPPTCEDLAINASEVVSYNPTTTKNGGPLPVSRQVATRALGEPDRVNADGGFVSLGFGGEIILKLPSPAATYSELECPALTLSETSFGNETDTSYPESARVFVSDSSEGPWHELSPVAILDEVYWDFSATEVLLETYQYVRIVDASNINSSRFPGNADGYDVDGIIAYVPFQDLNDVSVLDYLTDAGTFGLTQNEAAQVMNELLQPQPEFSDPTVNALLALLQQYLDWSAGPGDFAAIPVAASGNYRVWISGNLENPFIVPVPPLQPALDTQTIAVCGGLGSTNSLAFFSHDGNICVPGAWYQFADGGFGSGTSFAAPAFSAYAAAWLTYEDPDTCNFVDPANPARGRVPLKSSESVFNNQFIPLNSTPLDCEPPVEPVQNQVLSYSLIDAQTNQVVPGYENITGNITLPANIPPQRVSFRANTNPEMVGSVKMEISGPINWSRIEDFVPYALFGDNNGNYSGRPFHPGVYTLKATPFSSIRAKGDAGIPLEIQVTINAEVEESFAVTQFFLVDAQSDTVLYELTDNAVIDLSITGDRLNILAVTNPAAVGSVSFELSGRENANRVESVALYALFGDNNGDYRIWRPKVGEYSLTATPYTKSGAKGTAGTSLSIDFEVVSYTETFRVEIPAAVVAIPREVEARETLTSGIARPTFTWERGITDDESQADETTHYNITVMNASGTIVMDAWVDAAACGAGGCLFTPDESLLPYGLLNGDYSFWVRGWAKDTFSDLGDEAVIRVNVPAPVLPAVTVDASSGRPVITWPADANSAWTQVYIGQQGGNQVYLEWVANSAICDAVTCTLAPALDLTPGTYDVYVQAWGAGGYSRSDADGWAGPMSFNIGGEAPAMPANLRVSYSDNGYAVLRWTAAEGATHYQLWIGTDAEVEVYSDWYAAAVPVCENGECAVTVTMTLPDGEYVWYMRAYGPGGYSIGGVDGWAQGPTFAP